MGLIEGIGTITAMTIVYLASQDMTTVIITGIMCIAMMMKGDND